MTTILHSNLEADLREADRIEGIVRTTLVDMATIQNVPGAVLYLGDVAGARSDTARIPYASLDGTDAFTATAAENTAVATTALTDTSVTVAVVRHAIRRDLSDLANLTSSGPGDISTNRMVASMVGEYQKGWSDTLADSLDGFSATAGTTTVDMDVDDWYEAQITLQIADVPGPYFCALHPRQVSDFQTSLRAEGGAAQWQPATAEMLAMKGQGFIGMFNGVSVFKLSTVNTFNTAADRAGAMWGSGALGWMSGTPSFRPGVITTTPGPFLTVELQRPIGTATDALIGHAYYGISILEQSRGVSIITDA